MGKSRRRLWLIVALVGFAAALLPYPGSTPAPATASTTRSAPVAPSQYEVPTSASSSDAPASAYGAYGSPSGPHRSGY